MLYLIKINTIALKNYIEDYNYNFYLILNKKTTQ